MQFVGKAAGTKVDILFDSGASTNYVSSAFARMHGLTVKPSDTNVRLGTGTVSLLKASALYISSWATIKTEWNAMFLIW
jgi:predicted aspartyl protease